MLFVAERCGHDFCMVGSTQAHSGSTREAIWFSLLLAIVLAVTIGTIVLRIDPARASWFSDLFKMSVDLGQCAMSLSRPLIGNVLLALVSGAVAMTLLVLSLVELYTSKLRLRPHGMLLLGIAGLASLLLIPSASGEGTWIWSDTGGRFRLALDDACERSEGTVFYRVYGLLAIHAFLAWLSILAGVFLKQRISESQPLPRFSAYGRNAPRTQVLEDDLVERIPAAVRMMLMVIAALAIIFYGASLKFSVSRLYHQLAWIQQPATITELGSVCEVQSQERGVWEVVSRMDCTRKGTRLAPSDFVAADPTNRRLIVRPQATLKMQLPEGDKMLSRVEGYFFLPPTPTVGETFVLLRNPANPRKLDRTFDIQDVGKTFGRLLILTFATIAIYLLWFRFDVRQPDRASGRSARVVR